MFVPVLIASALLQTPPAEPFDGAARVHEAVEAVRAVALNPAGADWAALEAELAAEAAGAEDTADLLPVYVRLLDALGDHHSFVQADAALLEAHEARAGRGLYAGRPRRELTSAFIGREEIAGRDLALYGGGSARVLTVPQMAGGGAVARQRATALFEAVAGAGEGTCGYVVDLRGNQGGNVWPMLVGLSPLLGDGPQGVERDASGRDLAYAELREGAAVVLEGEYAGMAAARAEGWRPLPGLTEAPVAVLIDDAVASSGEGVAVAFSGRPSTRFFGERTFGVASSNTGVTLSDGVNLVVTTGMMVDRLGRIHPEGISPDETVAHGPGDPADPEDAVVEAAADWLADQPGCGG